MPIKFALLALLFSSSAFAAGMQSVAEFEQVTPLQVKGANPRAWNSPLSFGQWHSAKAEQGPVTGFGLKLLGLSLKNQQQLLQLSISNNELWQHIECVSKQLEVGMDGWSLDTSLGKDPIFACGIQGNSSSRLALSSQWDNSYKGVLMLSDKQLSIHSVHRMQGSKWPMMDPSGYVISDDTGPLMQVEVINEGRVWFKPDLPAMLQSELAAAAAALLLYKPEQMEQDF